MRKNLTTKTPPGDFQVITPKTPLLSQQAITSKGISNTLPTYSWTLTPISNRTCSVVTVPLSDARLPSTWLTVARILVHDFNHQSEMIVGCKVLQFMHTMKIRKMLGHKILRCKYTTISPRKRWTRLRTLSPVTICLNKVCSILVQVVYCLTALKIILLYV